MCCPNKLTSDHAQVEISKKFQDILHTLFIGSWQSEPQQQHKSSAGQHFQIVKTTADAIIDHSVVPASTWLLCLLVYVCFLLCHTYYASIKLCPLQCTTVSTVVWILTPCYAVISGKSLIPG